MKYVYILQSVNFPNTYYVGITSDLKKRLEKHNSTNHKYSQRFRPWLIKNYFAFKDTEKAVLFERYLKTSSGRSFCKRHF